MSAPPCTRCCATVGGTPGGGHPPARMKGTRCGPTARTGHNDSDAPLHRRNEGPHEHLAGQPLSPRGDLRRQRHQLRGLLRGRRAGRAVPASTTTGAETRLELPEVDGFVWHGYVPGVQPGQRYGYRVHGPYDPENGHALQPGQAAARPLRQGGRRPGRLATRRCSPTASATPTDRNDRRPRSATRCPSRWWSTRSSTGATTARRGTPYHETRHLRGARQGPDDAAPRRSPRSSAGTYAGLAHPAIIEHLHRPRRDRGRADAGAPVRPRHARWSSRACATTGATTRSASSRRTTATPARGTPRPAGARVQGAWSRRCTRPASR